MIINSFISALSFYIIPVFIGYAIVRLKNVPFKDELSSEKTLTVKILDQFRYFTYGSLGIYVIFCAALLGKNNGLGIEFTHATIFITLLFLIYIPLLIVGLIPYFKNIKNLNIFDILDILFLIMIALLTYAIWRWDSGINTTLNWDIYHHQTLATLIQGNNFDIVTSNLSDSFQFDGYSTLFHTQVAITQKIFNPDLLAYWWFIELFHLFTTVAVSFALAFAVTKKRWVSYIGAIIGALIFESAVSYTSLFLIPQNLAATVTVGYIASIINRYAQSRDTSKILTIDFVVYIFYIMLSHIVIGTLGVFLVAFSKVYLLLKSINKGKSIQGVLFVLSFILLIIVPLIAQQFDLNNINRGEAEFFNYTLEEKYNLMKQFYGFSLVFLPLGYIYAIRQKNHSYNLLLIITNGLLALIIAHIPYSLKFFTLGRFTVHTVMALGVWLIIQHFNKYIKFLSLKLIYLTFSAIFVINISDYKQVPAYKEISTHVTQNEIDAANFLKSNYTGHNILLVSDPATMHILEGLSGINSPGGSYTSLHTREVLSDVYFIRDEQITQKLFQIRDGVVDTEPDKILFVISGRFSKWQLGGNVDKFGIHWNIWSPFDLSSKDLEDHDFIYYLRENLRYNEVFRNEGLIIFEIEKPPITTVVQSQ